MSIILTESVGVHVLTEPDPQTGRAGHVRASSPAKSPQYAGATSSSFLSLGSYPCIQPPQDKSRRHHHPKTRLSPMSPQAAGPRFSDPGLPPPSAPQRKGLQKGLEEEE